MDSLITKGLVIGLVLGVIIGYGACAWARWAKFEDRVAAEVWRRIRLSRAGEKRGDRW